MNRRALYIAGAALGAGGFTAVVLLVRGKMLDAKAQQLADSLAPRLPPRLARWAYPVCYGAVRSRPGDFTGEAAGYGLEAFTPDEAWALLGFAIMDHESLGGDGSGYAPLGEWEGFGDVGHAVTPWQIDVRFHKRFYSSGQWRDPAAASLYVYEKVIAPNWRRFAGVGAYNLAATIDAYNASGARVSEAVAANESPDSVTTGGNYSADVLARLALLAA